MVGVVALLGVLFLLLLALLSIYGGLRQLYHALIGNQEQLQVGSRFKFLFGFKDPTLKEKRLFWSIGGLLLILGGLAFLGMVAFSVSSVV